MSNFMELTSENVETTFISCLFNSGDDTSNAKIVEGVQTKVGFDPKKLEAQKENIISMLSQCDERFMADGESKGFSFLALCEDRNGNLWTSLHAICDQLICLGMAIDKVVILLPRPIWQALPGGMPYLAIKR